MVCAYHSTRAVGSPFSTGQLQLSLCWSGSPKGGGQKACSMTGRGVEERTLGTYPTRGYRQALVRPGAKSRCEGATERACRSQTLLREYIARRKEVFNVRWRSEISSIVSKGDPHRASRTTERSQGGTRDHTWGLSLITLWRKNVTRASLPTDWPMRGAWLATIAAT